MSGKITLTVVEIVKNVAPIIKAVHQPLLEVIRENGAEPFGGQKFWDDMQEIMLFQKHFHEAAMPATKDYYRKTLKGRKSTGFLNPGVVYRSFKYLKSHIDATNEAMEQEQKVLRALLAKGGSKLVDEYIKNPKATLEKVALEEVTLH